MDMNLALAKIKQSYDSWNGTNLNFTSLHNHYFAIDSTLSSNIDCVSIYGKVLKNGSIVLTDFGYTIFHLNLAGITLSKVHPLSWYIFQNILKLYHIHFNSDNSLTIHTTIKNLPATRINFLKAISKIEDITYLYTKINK